MKYFIIFFLLAAYVSAQPPATLLAGRVTGYVTNRIGDYEGIQLQLPTGDPVALRFPPHAAREVVRVGPVGQRVDAEATMPGPGRGRPDMEKKHNGHGRPGPYRLVRLSQPETGMAVDLREIPPPLPQTGTFTQAEGNMIGTLTDNRGHLIGLLIDKTYLLELRPHQSDLLRALLGTMQRIGFSGYQRPSAGFVNQTGRAVVRPQTLTIDGKTYAF